MTKLFSVIILYKANTIPVLETVLIYVVDVNIRINQ